MGLFKTDEEKQRKKELERRIEELDRFTGSLEEYNSLKGEDYMIMDTGRPQKFVTIYIEDLFKQMVSQGCTALIRYVPLDRVYGGLVGGHGIPVKKK